jgi:endonuclease-8
VPLRVSSPQGRFSDSAAALNGQCIVEIDAHGKHLFYWWENDELLHVHLGLFGKFRQTLGTNVEERGAIRLRLVNQEQTLDLRGPTACDLIDGSSYDRLLARLGPDPLRDDADPERFFARARRSRVAIGALLMDQSAIAGVGNVFRAEALFVCGMAPDLESRLLSDEDLLTLWRTITDMLRAGVTSGRIITVDPEEVGTPRSRMRRGERNYVYRRSTCLRCETPIQRTVLGARNLFACPRCQPTT